MPVVARCNGTVLVEEPGRISVVEQGGGVGTAIFVSGLVAVILGGNGIYWLFQAPAMGAAGLGLAVVAAGVAALFRRRRRRAAAAEPGAPRLVFDLTAGLLRDGRGTVLSELAGLTLARAFQLGSSSPMLVARHAKGRVVVARGSPFGDSVDALERALVERGVSASQAKAVPARRP